MTRAEQPLGDAHDPTDALAAESRERAVGALLRIPTLRNEVTWYPYSPRRTALAGLVLRAVASRGISARLGLTGRRPR